MFSVDIFRAKLWSKPYCWRMKSFLEEFTCSIFLKMLDVVDIFRAKLCSKPSREDERVYSHFERKYLHQIRRIRKTFWLLRFLFFLFSSYKGFLNLPYKGWLAIAKLKPLSLFISLFQHCQMLSEALIIEK